MKSIQLTFITLLLAGTAAAKNIDLSTVPARDTVQLTIYNAEDLTLVRETRLVTFKQGSNPLQFSWANTLIDPTSVELKFLTHPDELTVLDTTYPHDKPQMLYWNVRSVFAGEARIEISYFTSRISWSADYVGITDVDEAQMALEGRVTVTNNSGEDYEQAQVRLVVGQINLVEPIADLAQRGIVPGTAGKDEYRKNVMHYFVKKADRIEELSEMVPSDEDFEQKQIIKEGLSEYFIFTIEGTETVPNGWSKRMRSFDATEVPFSVQYRYRPREYGDSLVKMFLLSNSKESQLGESPLPDGTMRIFRQTGHDGLSFLTQQATQYIPIGDKIELNLGSNPEIVFELIQLREFRDNIWGTWDSRIRRRFDQPGIQIADHGQVTGWDEHTVFDQRIGNYTDKPIEVEIRRTIPGDVTFKTGLDPVLHDFQTVQLKTLVTPGKTANLVYEVITKQGDNAKQNRVRLEEGKPETLSFEL